MERRPGGAAARRRGEPLRPAAGLVLGCRGASAERRRQLSGLLADEFGYPLADRTELARVSGVRRARRGRGTAVRSGSGTSSDAEYPPNSVHRFLAALPASLEAKGKGHLHQLVITTNYDDILERAFSDAGEPYEVVVYMAGGEDHGRFVHCLADGERRLIDRPQRVHRALVRHLLRDPQDPRRDRPRR